MTKTKNLILFKKKSGKYILKILIYLYEIHFFLIFNLQKEYINYITIRRCLLNETFENTYFEKKNYEIPEFENIILKSVNFEVYIL